MLSRLIMLALAIAGGFVAASLLPEASLRLRTALGIGATAPAATPRPPAEAATADAAPSTIKLNADQIERAGIRTAPVTGGRLVQHLHVPATIVPSANNSARIAVRTPGTVVELRKTLGDRVTKGEVVALLDSREIADAKSEYLAARVAADLQKNLYERDKALWDQRVSSEQQFLRSQATYTDLQVKADTARRKLMFLGLSPADIEALPKRPEAQIERQEIRSPIAGRIVERRVELGAAVGRDSLETELYGVLNLAQVWVDLAVTPGDLPLVREGQAVTVRIEATGQEGRGRIIFIGPVLDQNTRVARVVAELANPDEQFRPGTFASAEIETSNRNVRVMIPAEAIQTINGKPTAFLRTDDGFAARTLEIARRNDRGVEVTAGLDPGEHIAVANSFILKSELGKAAAED